MRLPALRRHAVVGDGVAVGALILAASAVLLVG